MKKIRLTKIIDDAFEGNHPNGINVGYVKEGFISREPELGERFYIGASFSTSPVTQLPDADGIFKTTYSTYKLETIE